MRTAGAWYLGSTGRLRNGDSVAICIYERFATLCRLRLGFRPFTRKSGARMGSVGVGVGFGFGSPKGDAWATQGPPRGHPSVAQGSIGDNCFICNKSKEKAGWGWAGRAKPRVDRVIAVIGSSGDRKPYPQARAVGIARHRSRARVPVPHEQTKPSQAGQ